MDGLGAGDAAGVRASSKGARRVRPQARAIFDEFVAMGAPRQVHARRGAGPRARRDAAPQVLRKTRCALENAVDAGAAGPESFKPALGEVLSQLAKARSAHGQERVTVHCAMTSRRGKTLGWDKASGGYKRLSTKDYAFGAEGILVSSYRVASLSALGMANAEPLNEDGERGCITLTASVAAQDGQIGQVIYGSCKAGVNGLVLPMARDLMDLGIRVNSVMPGIFATPLMLGMKDRNPQMWDQLNASVPFPKRLGHPEEFASLICEIARNSYINAHQFRLDGAIRMPPR